MKSSLILINQMTIETLYCNTLYRELLKCSCLGFEITGSLGSQQATLKALPLSRLQEIQLAYFLKLKRRHYHVDANVKLELSKQEILLYQREL